MRWAALVTAMAVTFVTMPVTGQAQTPASDGERGITVELNKLEPVKSACRAWLVVRNQTEAALASLRLDLVMFGADGVIARRLAVETAPLAAGKTAVRLFDVEGTACDGIARILLNDVLSCRDEAGDRDGCLADMAISSRAQAEFVR